MLINNQLKFKNLLKLGGILTLFVLVTFLIIAFYTPSPVQTTSLKLEQSMETKQTTESVSDDSWRESVQRYLREREAGEASSSMKKETAEDLLYKTAEKIVKGDNTLILKEGNEWVVSTIVEQQTDFAMFTRSKQLSRDFIFAIYATSLPIKHVSISNNYYPTGKYYRVGLGKDVAATQPNSTWTNEDIGPTIFYDWLKTHTNGSAGNGKNSTYLETNLD